MGCDIYAAIEFRIASGQPWQAVFAQNKYFDAEGDRPELTARLDIERDYDLFAILANVRNESFYGGIYGYKWFVPMSSQRGVPEDISAEARAALSDEHSATWITLADIFSYDWDRGWRKAGVVSLKEFAAWDRTKEWKPEPGIYSPAVYGQGVCMVTNEQMREAVMSGDDSELLYTGIEWVASALEAGQQIWTKIVSPLLTKGIEHGFDNVRMVMDFCS